MADVSAELLERNNLTGDDIAWLVPHQANLRIIDATANRMGLSHEKVMINIQRYGNTTAGTIPLCLWEWEKKLKKGDLIVLAAFGGGFTWGATLVKWAYDSKCNLTWKTTFLYPVLVLQRCTVVMNRIQIMRTWSRSMQAALLYLMKQSRACAGSAGRNQDIYIPAGAIQLLQKQKKRSPLFETFGIQKNGKQLEVKAILHASGMAAITNLMLSTLKAGDKILAHYSFMVARKN